MFVFGRFNIFRSSAIFLKRSSVRKYKTTSKFQNLNVTYAVESLNKDGVCLGIKLPKDVIEEILNFAHSNICYGNGNFQMGFLSNQKEQAEEKYAQKFITAEYYNSSLLCPAIKELVNDRKLLEIAAKYLGTDPVYTGSRLHWNFVANKRKYDLSKVAMMYHYDLDDYHSLRFFFYLTDVDLYSGPHTVVRGSHKKKRLKHKLSFYRSRSDEEIIKYYGSDNLVNIYGEAGFGFAEDTFCFHKASPPILRNRLMLQIQFAMNNYGNHNDIVDPSLLKIGL